MRDSSRNRLLYLVLAFDLVNISSSLHACENMPMYLMLVFDFVKMSLTSRMRKQAYVSSVNIRLGKYIFKFTRMRKQAYVSSVSI